MKKSKDELLKELQALGVRSDGRKIRSDKGKSRPKYNRLHTPPRSDKGFSRPHYSKEGPRYHERIFTQFITAHVDPTGFGDNLTRDTNMIFPPHITSYYKLITRVDGTTYRSSVRRRNHPEELRWNWFMAEYRHNPKDWEELVCNWYFITKEDLRYGMWTYNEWAWSYVNAISGHPNRVQDGVESHMVVTLLYDAFAEGAYGQIQYDDNGLVDWSKI